MNHTGDSNELKQVRLIAIDMDGTLLLSDHYTVPEQNIKAIRAAHAAGITVCISTGRMLEDASDFIHRLGLPCMIIAANGARISDRPLPEGKIIYRRNFADGDALAAVDLLLPFGMMINGFEDGYVNTVLDETEKEYHLVYRDLIGVRHGEAVLREAAGRSMMKIFVIDHPAAVSGNTDRIQAARRAIRHAMPHLEVVSSSGNNLEIMPGGVGKGDALAFLTARLGLDRSQVMAIGDAENDLSMLRYAGHSVAMGNAVPAVSLACRHQTASNDDCGVAFIINRVLESLNL